MSPLVKSFFSESERMILNVELNGKLWKQSFTDFLQKETPTQVFSCEICEIYKNTLFYRTLPVVAFESLRPEI